MNDNDWISLMLVMNGFLLVFGIGLSAVGFNPFSATFEVLLNLLKGQMTTGSWVVVTIGVIMSVINGMGGYMLIKLARGIE